MAKVYRSSDRIKFELKVYPVESCKDCDGTGRSVSGNGKASMACTCCHGLAMVRAAGDQVDQLTFIFRPLTVDERTSMTAPKAIEAGKEVPVDTMTIYRRIIKASLKKVDGLEDLAGNKVELPKDQDGNVTDEGVEMLFGLEYSTELFHALNCLMLGLPKEVKLPAVTAVRSDIKVQGLTGAEAENF